MGEPALWALIAALTMIRGRAVGRCTAQAPLVYRADSVDTARDVNRFGAGELARPSTRMNDEPVRNVDGRRGKVERGAKLTLRLRETRGQEDPDW